MERPKSKKRPWNSPKPIDCKVVRAYSMSDYHTSRWTKEAKAFKESHPLCEICKSKGIIKAADVVDHITPAPICKDFFDESNWQSLCQECNIAKGNKDKIKIKCWRINQRGRGV